MNRILDVEYPIVNCYPSTSNALAILQTHSEMEGWIYCNFIQLFNTDEYTIDYFDFDAYNCPFINYGEIDYNVISCYSSYKEFICKMIDNGYYVSAYVEKSMVNLYQSDSGLHQLFIFGYDLGKNIYYCADHFASGKYSFEACDMEEVLAAISSIKDKKYINKAKGERFIEDYFCFQFYRYDFLRHRIKIKFLSEKKDEIIERIKKSLSDYLNGNKTENWCTRMDDMGHEETLQHKWGIQVYDIMIKHLDYLLESEHGSPFGRQSFFVMHNHKKVMKLRLIYLREKCLFDAGEKLFTMLDGLIEDTYSVCMSYIKCCYLKREKRYLYLMKLYTYVRQNKEKEYIFFSELLKQLS